jgi:hypothetical protein
MKRRMIFSEIGENALATEDHSQMADAYEKVAADPRLMPEKREEYLRKGRRARELSLWSNGRKRVWRKRRAQKR